MEIRDERLHPVRTHLTPRPDIVVDTVIPGLTGLELQPEVNHITVGRFSHDTRDIRMTEQAVA
jgi:hypothetical protein